MAVVVFWLPRTGAPSQISIKSSSGSNDLDAAAISCVARLRFAPATTLGTGDPIDSWQQIAFRWTNQGGAGESQAMSSPKPIAATPAQTPANARQETSGGQADSVTVAVCVDATGKLEHDPTIIHSSGMASVDLAAVKIAASGSAYYRPETSSGAPPMSGCAQLTIKFDAK